jgi:hypothetical protein
MRNIILAKYYFGGGVPRRKRDGPDVLAKSGLLCKTFNHPHCLSHPGYINVYRFFIRKIHETRFVVCSDFFLDLRLKIFTVALKLAYVSIKNPIIVDIKNIIKQYGK